MLKSLANKAYKIFISIIGPILGYLIGLMMLPHQLLPSFVGKIQLWRFKIQNKKRLHNIEIIETKVNGIATITMRKKNSAKTSKNFIIRCYGIQSSYQDYTSCEQMLIFAENYPETTVVGFNYSGVTNSDGCITNGNTMANNITSVVEHLINNERVDPGNITVYGHSLGALMACKSVAELSTQKDKLYKNKLFADRAPINIAKAIAKTPINLIMVLLTALAFQAPFIIAGLDFFLHFTLASIFKYLLFSALVKVFSALLFRQTLSNTLEKSLSWLTKISRWDQNSLDNYLKIQDDLKNYSVAKSPTIDVWNDHKKQLVEKGTKDRLIHWSASLDAALQAEKAKIAGKSTQQLKFALKKPDPNKFIIKKREQSYLGEALTKLFCHSAPTNNLLSQTTGATLTAVLGHLVTKTSPQRCG